MYVNPEGSQAPKYADQCSVDTSGGPSTALVQEECAPNSVRRHIWGV